MVARRRVIENFPAERLPRELLGEIDPKHRVRVIIEDQVEDALPRPPFAKFFGAAKERNTSQEEAVDRIRRLRDEWDG
jgi:hypothetical protein